MFVDILSGIWWLIERCLMGVAVVYGLLAHILPNFMVFSDSHTGWHNFLVGICWIGLYIFLALKYLGFCSRTLSALAESGLEEYGFVVFPAWHWALYAAAALTPVAASYFGWPVATSRMWIPLAAIPQIYLLVRGAVVLYPMLLARQLGALLLVAVAIGLFLPLAFAALLIMLVGAALGGSAGALKGAGAGGGHREVCPHCGVSMSAKGLTCPCGRSTAAYGYDFPRAAGDFPRDAWNQNEEDI